LGPPLVILPRSIEPAELQAYRVGYQAFRAGQATGARGDIWRLPPKQESFEELLDVASPVAEASGPGVSAGDVEEGVVAYYSEPEMDTRDWLANSPVAAEDDAVAQQRRFGTKTSPQGAPISPSQQRGRQFNRKRTGSVDPMQLQTSSSSSPSPQLRRAMRPVSVLQSPRSEFAHPGPGTATPLFRSPLAATVDPTWSPKAFGPALPGNVECVAESWSATASAPASAFPSLALPVPTASHGCPEGSPQGELGPGVGVQGFSAALAFAAAAASVVARAQPANALGSPLGGVPAASSSGAVAAEEQPPEAPPRRPTLGFAAWLADEFGSRPDEAQLSRVPRSHLLDEVTKVPKRLEKLLGFGFLLCLDILLHELTFTPLQVVWSFWRLPFRHLRSSREVERRLTVTEKGEWLRFALLVLNVALVVALFDDSSVYHYIRRESFLKLYVIFNMLEMFERWCRSIGVDLFDLLAASSREPWPLLVLRCACALLYCFVHSVMHLLRVLLLNVAINTSSSAVFLIIVTNSFGEIKSTVFKKYTPESLFPIVASDIVERFYLVVDLIFVLARLSISPRGGAFTWSDIAYWLVFLVAIEVATDWVKFCLIFKFSDLKASTLEVYQEVLIADILLCRSGSVDDVSRLFAEGAVGGAGGGRGAGGGAAGAGEQRQASRRPVVPFRGVHSFSHSLARRIGFCGIPFSTLVVVQMVMLLASPCVMALTSSSHRATSGALAVACLVATLLLKVLLAAILLGYAATRRRRIQKGLELFPKIRAL